MAVMKEKITAEINKMTAINTYLSTITLSITGSHSPTRYRQVNWIKCMNRVFAVSKKHLTQ